MLDNLKPYKVILASKSPRRQELLRGLGIDFKVKTLSDVSEDYPSNLSALEVAKYIAREKAEAYEPFLMDKELIITADTVVVVDDEVLGKPVDRQEAKAMLCKLSGKTHQVITGVCILTQDKQVLFDASTDVTFAKLTDEEINFYIDTYSPFDKAGAYGVQEWIGYIGVEFMQGSYFNVMGLPVQKLYTELKLF